MTQNPELEKKYDEYKKARGGAFKMTIDEIRKLYYQQKVKEDVAKKLLEKGISVEIVVESTDLSLEEVEILKKEICN